MKSLVAVVLFLFALTAQASLPPTSVKGANDAKPVTTFFFQFPWVNYTHNGSTGIASSLTSPLFSQQTTPTAPGSGFNLLYFKADNKLYALDSTGTEVPVGPAVGSPLTFAGYQTDGSIGSVPGWAFNTEGSANAGITVTTSLNGPLSTGVGVAGGATLASFDDFYNFFDSTGATITGAFRGTHLDSNGPVGGNYEGYGVSNNMAVGNDSFLAALYQNGNVAHDFRVYEGGNSGTVSHDALMLNMYNSGPITHDLNILNGGNNGNVGNNFEGLSLNNQGAITGSAIGLSFSNNGNVGQDLHLIDVGNSSGSVITGQFIGANIYNNENSNQLVMANLSDNSTTTTDKKGINLNLQGSAATVTGIEIDINSVATPGQQKTAINVNGGSVNTNYTIDTVDFTPSSEFMINAFGGGLHISSGHPINGGQFGFANNLGSTVFFEDDMGPDSSGFGLGWSLAGFVGQVQGATGKTFDTLNYMFGGAEDIGTGGTITHFAGFRTAGVLPTGGIPITIVNGIGFHVDALLDVNNATNLWGFRSDALLADNWFAKDLVIGGATKKPTNASVGLEIAGTTKALLYPRMTTTQRNALTAVNGMTVYDSTLDVFECYAGGSWGLCNTSSGSGTVTSVSVVTANGFAGTVATATSTPAITLTTSVVGVAKGASGALVAAVADTDYQTAGIVSFVTSTAGQNLNTCDNVYVSPGNAAGDTGRTAGLIYQLDDSGSNVNRLVYVGKVVAGVSSGAAVKIQTSGRITGCSGYVAGLAYFGSVTVPGADQNPQPATNGQYLQQTCVADSTTSCIINGAGGATALLISGGGGGSTAPVIQVKSANYTILGTDDIIEVTATSTQTLTDCATLTNNHVWNVANQSAAGVVTIVAGGANTITTGQQSGLTSIQLTDPGASIQMDCNKGSVIYVRQ